VTAPVGAGTPEGGSDHEAISQYSRGQERRPRGAQAKVDPQIIHAAQDERAGYRSQGAVRRHGTRPIPATPVPGQSKKAAVIVLLRRPEGATIAEVVAATDWQPHTVRGLFSGTLKKKLGLTLSSAQEQRGRVYRIIGTSGAGGAAEHSGGLRLSAADARSDG
jgi:hypothetical protein